LTGNAGYYEMLIELSKLLIDYAEYMFHIYLSQAKNYVHIKYVIKLHNQI